MAQVADTKVFLVRHGATEWNIDKRAQGQADIALTDLGRQQAEEAAGLLAVVDVEAVYSSDLSRARDTAAVIARRHGLDVEELTEFREIDQGEWTGLSTAEIQRRWPDRWGPARHYKRRPGGESPTELRARALRGLEKVVALHPGKCIVVVSHGGTIRSLVAEAMGFDDRQSAELRGLANGGVVRVVARIEDGRLELGDPKRLDGKTTDMRDPNA